MVPDEEFIRRRTTEVVLSDGSRVLLRPILPEDKAAILDGFARMSPESRYRRFMSPIDELTPEMLRFLTEIDYRDHFAWAAFAADQGGGSGGVASRRVPRRDTSPASGPPGTNEGPGMGVARYVRIAGEPDVAEAAVTVIDEYQQRGLGTLLLQALGAVALENGIRTFRGYVLEDNRQVREVIEPTGARLRHEGPGLVKVEVDLPTQAEQMTTSAAYKVLRALARGEAPRLLRWGALWAHPGTEARTDPA